MVCGFVVRIANETCTEEWDNCESYYVRSEERQNYSERQCGEKKLAHAVEKDHRKENNGCRKRGGKHRKRYFRAALFSCHFRGLTHLKMKKDILQHHHGVIDEPRKRKRQPPEHH